MATFVQGVGAGGAANTSPTDLVLSTNVTAGNAVVVFIFINDVVSVSSVTDSLSNAYTQALSFDDVSNTGFRVYAYYSVGISGGSCTIHTNFSSTGVGYGILAQEFSGVATSLPTNGTNHASGFSNANPTLSGSVTTTVNNDIVIGGLLVQAGITFTTGTGFSNLTTATGVNGNGTIGMLSGIKATAGASNPSFGTSGATGNSFVGATVALKPAATTTFTPQPYRLLQQAPNRASTY